MMSSYTPGPWYAAYSKTNEFGGGNIRSNHHVDGEGALLFETGPMFHDYEVNREEELANLRLASAAPDLFDSVLELLDVAQFNHSDCEWESDTKCRAEQYGDGNAGEHSYLRKAEQAIARAKGE